MNLKSYQLKNRAASHSERGIAYKPGEVIRTHRDLMQLHPAKFLEVGDRADSHWPADVPYMFDKSNADLYFVSAASGGTTTFRVMQGDEMKRRGLSFEKACQLARNWNNGKKSASVQVAPIPVVESEDDDTDVDDDDDGDDAAEKAAAEKAAAEKAAKAKAAKIAARKAKRAKDEDE